MPTYRKRAGIAPAGTLRVSVGGGTYTWDDVSLFQVNITDPIAVGALRNHPYIEMVPGSDITVPQSISNQLTYILDSGSAPVSNSVLTVTQDGFKFLPPQSPSGAIPSSTDPFRFDPTRLSTFKAALANRESVPVNILCIGDSITEGDHANRTTRWQNQLVGLLRTRYPTSGNPGGIGSLPPQYMGGSADGNLTGSLPVTITGSPTASSAGLGKRGLQLGSGQVVTYNLPVGVTGIDLSYLKGTGGGTNCTYSVDGGAAVTLNTNASSTGYFIEQCARGLNPAATHTIAFTGPTTNKFFVNDIVCYNGDESKGIRGPFDAGHSGWTPGDHLQSSTNGTAYREFFNTGTPQLIIIALGGINDWGTVDTSRKSPRQFGSDLRDLLAGLRGFYSYSTQPSIILWEQHRRGAATSAFRGAFEQYTQEVRRTARDDPYGVTVFDSAAVLGDASTNTNGYFATDLVHPLAAAHLLLAQNLDTLIASA